MPVPCARCDSPLPAAHLPSGEASCPSCGALNRVALFPVAVLAPPAPAAAENAFDGQAACYDHPAKRAIAACRQCGRFVCQICSVETAGETWCPSCVASGAGAARTANPVSTLSLYDSTALILPLASLLLYPFTLAAAPASLVLTVTKWSHPLSPVRRYRWRFVAAVLISLTEIALWVLGIFYLLSGRWSSPG